MLFAVQLIELHVVGFLAWVELTRGETLSYFTILLQKTWDRVILRPAGVH